MADWYPLAVRSPGPTDKFGGYVSGDFGPKRGEVKHSMAGSYQGALSVLNDPNSGSSWHFSVLKDGTVAQHFALPCNTWHGADSDDDDNVAANIDLIGVEHEGGPPGNESEPLTEAQVAATTELTRWMAAQYGFGRFARFGSTAADIWLLCEHNEVSNTATACPSGRIPWDEILRRLEATTMADGSDPTLVTHPERAGARVLIHPYVVEYNADGVPIWRHGGISPGATAKRFGDEWIYLRNPGDGLAHWSTEAGD